MTEVNLIQPKMKHHRRWWWVRQWVNYVDLLTSLISHNQNSWHGTETFRIEDLQWYQVLRKCLEIRYFVALEWMKNVEINCVNSENWINFVSLPTFDAITRVANKVIIQTNYSTYLNTTISDINLFNVFCLLVSCSVRYTVAEEFTMDRFSRRWFPRYSNRGGRCIMG